MLPWGWCCSAGFDSRYVSGMMTPCKDSFGINRIREMEYNVNDVMDELVCVQLELKNGELLRGELHEAEDNWNVQLSNVTATGRDGKVTHMEHIFVRGSRVRFVIVPDILKNAPMFKRIDPKNKMKNVALGVGGKQRR